MIKLLLVDDHQMFLDGISSILADEEDIQIIQEMPDGDLALKVLETEEVDVVVLDYEMPEMNGEEAARRIKEINSEIKILVLSMHKDKNIIKRLIKAGIHGFVLKNRGKKDLIYAIRKVMEGKKCFGEDIMELLIDEIADTDKKQSRLKIHLTRREKEVLKLVVDGFTSKQMAEKLFIAESTVETHRGNLLEKAGVKNSRALIKYAFDNDLLDS
ncbi:MAG: response regulator transcription factor [Cyclobacteriaceae bacterium]